MLPSFTCASMKAAYKNRNGSSQFAIIFRILSITHIARRNRYLRFSYYLILPKLKVVHRLKRTAKWSLSRRHMVPAHARSPRSTLAGRARTCVSGLRRESSQQAAAGPFAILACSLYSHCTGGADLGDFSVSCTRVSRRYEGGL